MPRRLQIEIDKQIVSPEILRCPDCASRKLRANHYLTFAYCGNCGAGIDDIRTCLITLRELNWAETLEKP